MIGSASGASVLILEPSDGSVSASGTVPVALEVAGFVLSDSNVSGSGATGFALATLDGSFSKTMSTPSSWFSNLSAGLHALSVQLYLNNGSPIGEPAASNFSVAAGTPRLAILSPAQGAVINSSSLEASVYGENRGVPDPSPWVRWSIDGRQAGTDNSTASNLTALAAGSHTLRAELLAANESVLSPAVWDEVTFELEHGSPYLRISFPAQGDTVRFVWALLFVQTQNFSLTPRLDPRPGQGKYRILVDGVETGFGTDPIGIAAGLFAGPHRIAAEFTDSAGIPLSPRVWDEVAVEGLGLVPRIRLASPLNGTLHWGSVVNMSVIVENFTLSELADGHVDYYVDGINQAMIPVESYTTTPLSAGLHTLSVGLSPPGHVRYPVEEPSVNVFVVSPPTVAIADPPTGTTIEGSAFQIKLRTEGMDLVDPRTNATVDTAHLLVLVDNASRGIASGMQVEISGLMPGTHEIRLSLVDGNGSVIPGAQSAAIVVNVRGASPWPLYGAIGIVAIAVAGVSVRTLRKRGR